VKATEGTSAEAIRVLFEEAAGRLGPMSVSYEQFRARLESLLATTGELPPPERADDLYLACGCQAGDPGALARFESLLMPGARAAMAKVSSSADVIDEAAQELRRRLFVGPAARIGRYSGRGPLWKWLRVTANRAAHDVIRERPDSPAVHEDVIDRIMRDDADPEFQLVRLQYKDLFREALEKALASLSADERTLLRLRYLENQGIDRLAVPFRAHRATIARRLQAIRDKLLDEVHVQLERRLPRLTEGDAHSIWRALQSQLHLSFARLVNEETTKRP
jgi:RNA polymerase sigma-70 factor (ECF subfamily)